MLSFILWENKKEKKLVYVELDRRGVEVHAPHPF